MMAKIYLINVGANTGHGGKARSPIFPNDTWIYVPFPRKHSTKEGQRFPGLTKDFVRVGLGTKCHLDPDWEGLTYGDCCKKPRAASLLKVQKGDTLLFWALLWRKDRGVSIFKSRDKGWYLIGALHVESILKDGERTNTLPRAARRADQNAHVYEGQVKRRDGERVFVGSRNRRHSRRFAKAVDLEVYCDAGLMHRVVRTKDGQQIRWNGPPRWNSVTRSCRAILDLDCRRDRSVARFLASRIGRKNKGFDLIDRA